MQNESVQSEFALIAALNGGLRAHGWEGERVSQDHSMGAVLAAQAAIQRRENLVRSCFIAVIVSARLFFARSSARS